MAPLNLLPPVPLQHPFSGSFAYPAEDFIALAEANMKPHPTFFNADDRRRIIYCVNAFTGRARLWYFEWARRKANDHQRPPDWYSVFKDDFLEQFCIPKIKTHDWLLRQLVHETTVGSYAEMFHKTALACKEDVDSQYNRLWWVYGLRGPLQEKILDVFPLLDTYAELVEASADHERFMLAGGDAPRTGRNGSLPVITMSHH